MRVDDVEVTVDIELNDDDDNDDDDGLFSSRKLEN